MKTFKLFGSMRVAKKFGYLAALSCLLSSPAVIAERMDPRCDEDFEKIVGRLVELSANCPEALGEVVNYASKQVQVVPDEAVCLGCVYELRVTVESELPYILPNYSQDVVSLWPVVPQLPGDANWFSTPIPDELDACHDLVTRTEEKRVTFQAIAGKYLTLSIGGDGWRKSAPSAKITAIEVDAKYLAGEKDCTSCGDPAGDSNAKSAAQKLSESQPVFTEVLRGELAFAAEEQHLTGFLAFAPRSPSTDNYSPAQLNLSPNGLVDPVWALDSSGRHYLRQVRGADGLIDVLIDSSTQYRVRIFGAAAVGAKQNRVYQLTGNPLKTITVSNPNTANNNSILVRATIGATTTTIAELAWNSSNQGWTKVLGGGAATVVESSQAISGTVTRFTQEQRSETGVTQSKVVQDYETFGGQDHLISEVVNPGPTQRETTFVYYTNPADHRYRLLQEEFGPAGAYRCSDYDTNQRPITICEPFLNLPSGSSNELIRLTAYGYDLLSGAGDDGSFPNQARSVTNFIKGFEVGRKYLVRKPGEVREIQCQTPGAAWNAPDNLVTITKEYTNGPFAGLVYTVLAPDGNLTLHEYATNSSYRTNIVYRGQPGSSFTNVTAGTKSVTVLNLAGHPVFKEVRDIASGRLMDQETYSNFDERLRPQRVTYLDGTFKDTVYGCCGIDSETDRNGVTTLYQYDALNRVTNKIVNGISYMSHLDAAGRVVAELRAGTNESPVLLKGYKYDAGGMLLAETNALGGITTYAETINSGGGYTNTITYPDGGTRIEVYSRDKLLLKVFGTAAQPLRYDYGVEWDDFVYRFYKKEIKLDAAGNDTTEWAKTYTDMLGREYKTVYSGPAGAPPSFSKRFFNNKGQLWKEADPDGVAKLYQYNGKGELEYTAIDINRNDSLDLAGPDRVVRSVSDVVANYSTDVLRTQTYNFQTNGVGTQTLTSLMEVSRDRLRSWITAFGLVTKTQTAYGSNGVRYETNTAPDNSYSVSQYSYGRLISITQRDSAGVQIGKITYGYDAKGRQNSVTDARTGTTTYTFNQADLVVTTTTPAPGTGASAQVTTNFYDTSLRNSGAAFADGTSMTNQFYPSGVLKKSWGSRTFPVEYTYDAQGRMLSMKTWQDFSSNLKAAVTTWEYDAWRGFLLKKRYPYDYDPDNFVSIRKGTDYTYTLAGRLATRTWARGVVTTYGYNNAGDLRSVGYSDGVTPGVVHEYDRAGRMSQCDQNGLVTAYDYSEAGLLRSEQSGGRKLSYGYDSLLRKNTMALQINGVEVLRATNTFDNASRLLSMGEGSHSAVYSYLTNSSLLQQVMFKEASTSRLVQSRGYDNLNRLSGITNTPGYSDPLLFAYGYNQANQRTNVTLADASSWRYGYDTLGQVASGKRYWSGSVPVAGQQYEYVFDSIGNRKTSKAGGDSSGGSLRQTTYTINVRNEATSQSNPAGVDIVGAANGTATVTVNGTGTYRRNEYFHRPVPVSNGSGPVFAGITNVASLEGSSLTNIGTVYVPPASESFTHDDDGNLTVDGQWNYTWDGENRLIRMESKSVVPAAHQRKLEFAYDCKGRRTGKKVYGQFGTTNWVLTAESRYAYDGWNLIAELNGNEVLQKTWLWGQDLSGTMDQAGGVGGLIKMTVHQPAVSHHFAAYDGNGNVAGLVNAANGILTALYEHGPFGEMIRASGEMARVNPFRWSTKYVDDETDLVYYGYRYYSPSTGRWLSRDPIEEQGGLNLYGFVRNSPINRFDLLGKYDYNSSIDMFLEFWFGGRHGDGGVSGRMLDDAMSSSPVQSFAQSVLAEGREFWKCGTSKEFARTLSLDDFNPANDMKWYSAAGADWILTGNWQLYLIARCTAKCQPCGTGCRCKCYTRCTIMGDFSKLYTFVWVGGNPANIFTTPFAVLLPTETYRIHERFTIPALDADSIPCK